MVKVLDIMVGAVGQRVAVRRGCAGTAVKGELKFNREVGNFSIGDMVIEPVDINCVTVYINPTNAPTTIIELFEQEVSHE